MKLIHQHYDYGYEYDTVQLAELFDLPEFLWAAFWAMNFYIHSSYAFICLQYIDLLYIYLSVYIYQYIKLSVYI